MILKCIANYSSLSCFEVNLFSLQLQLGMLTKAEVMRRSGVN